MCYVPAGLVVLHGLNYMSLWQFVLMVLKHHFSCEANVKFLGEILSPMYPQHFHFVPPCPVMILYVLNY